MMMNNVFANSETTILKKSRTGTDGRARLMGNRLLAARMAWVAVVVVNMVIFFMALPLYHNGLSTAMLATEIGSLQITSGDITRLGELGISFDSFAVFLSGLHLVLAVSTFAIGFFIFWRKSDDLMALLTSLMIVLVGSLSPLWPIQLTLVSMNDGWYIPVHLLIGLDRFSIAIFLYLFPDGRFAPRWMRWPGMVLSLCFFWPLITAFSPLNPYQWSIELLGGIQIFLLSIAAVTQAYRLRRVATPTQRLQTKWMFVGIIIALVLASLAIGVTGIILPFAAQTGWLQFALYLMYQVGLVASVLVFVISISFAVLRYRLWDVDLALNRSLVYGGVSLLLGVIFLVSALLLQSILQALTGGMQSPLALGISAVVIGGLFQPARRRLQHVVDRRFYHLRADLNQLNATPPGVPNPGALSGQAFGPYQLQEPLGRGGMSEVYKGYHPTLGRVVAVKILPSHLAMEEDFRKRFEREARTVAALKHPHIVNMFDFGVLEETSYMVMEYVEGHDLGDHLKEHGRLTLDEALPIITDVAEALDYAHHHQVVHRDVKPSNIMLELNNSTPEGHHSKRAILTDFGIARILADSTALTKTGMIGTLDYIAPEQIISARQVDYRADIYSMGVMVYQMLTGELPFMGENAGSIVFGHLQRPAPDARDIVDDLPESAAKAIQKAMTKEPEQRFQSAAEFVSALSG